MREGWAEIFKCVMSLRSGLVVGDGQINELDFIELQFKSLQSLVAIVLNLFNHAANCGKQTTDIK